MNRYVIANDQFRAQLGVHACRRYNKNTKDVLRNDYVVILADPDFKEVTVKQFKRRKYSTSPVSRPNLSSLLHRLITLCILVTYRTKGSRAKKERDLSSLELIKKSRAPLPVASC